jgi:uncharacterized RDD family membrane protein YckC
MSNDAKRPLEGLTMIAGFWRRLGADIFDILLLSAVCIVMGILFYDQIASLGSNGRIIGWLIVLVYFTVLNSEVSNGQTLGKRLLGLRVVDADGGAISLQRSFIRAIVLTAPFIASGYWLIADNSTPSLQLILFECLDSLLVFGAAGSIIYLYLFNRRTRQCLHDLAVGSFVIEASGPSFVEARTASMHKVIVGVFCAVTLIAPAGILVLNPTSTSNSISPLAQVAASVQSMPEVRNAQVIDQTYVSNLHPTKSIILVRVQLKAKPDDFEHEATRIAANVLKNPDALGGKDLGISIDYGIDLGLAHWTKRYMDTRSAGSWNASALLDRQPE